VHPQSRVRALHRRHGIELEWPSDAMSFRPCSAESDGHPGLLASSCMAARCGATRKSESIGWNDLDVGQELESIRAIDKWAISIQWQCKMFPKQNCIKKSEFQKKSFVY